LRQAAFAAVGSDPAAAFALADEIPESDRRKFYDTVLADWASKDTQAALDWSKQFTDPADRDAALNTIRTAAPVGIGAALAMKDGLPVVNGLIPGAPAELSGQLHPGDRILGLAQGDNAFLDAHNLSLQDVVKMVRGDPGTLLQLQVLPADAPEGATPRTISIVREQVKFKR
jgi:C-terminal processing protease CtpA/Prc